MKHLKENARGYWYVGVDRTGHLEAFRHHATPTARSHGLRYHGAIGPFITRRGAEFMAIHGGNNPHCRSVKDAEAMAQRRRA